MSGSSAIWLDGAPVPALPLPDRGLDYGDGLFETLLLCQGRPLYSRFHLERLMQGLQVLAIPDCLASVEQQLEVAAREIGERNWAWTALRLTVVRAPGPRGYAPGDSARARILAIATRLERDCGQMAEAATLTQVTHFLAAQPLLAGIKHLNRLEQVLAANEVKRMGRDEGLMRDSAGRPISLVSGNLFLVRNDQLRTPLLEDCGVQGTRRRLILERWAPALNLDCREEKLSMQDILEADEVLYSNSLLGVRPVASFEQSVWSSHPVCEALFQQFSEELPC
ncbi:MAG: aminodeoxychorismate lyase [Halioglobus sp.]|nr:aminodeoxychorismate lyase [Halioglobus sp.]